jgi:phosphate transport system substrate-binding protein
MNIKASRKWAFLIPVVLLVLGILLAGCSKNLSGTVTEGGSTTVQPLAEALAKAFQAKNSGVTITTGGGGTGAGITGANDGTLDIGAASRDLKSTEPPLVKFLLAKDALAIITKSDNPVVSLGLTKAQVVSIFNGNYTYWSEVDPSLPHQRVTVYVRESGSGTRDGFQTLVMGSENITTSAIVATSSGAMKQQVGADSYGIGFESMAYVTGGAIKALTIDGMVATQENAKDGTYTLVRPLYFLTKEQPTGLVKDFIDYCLGPEGQKVVADEGYIAVS